MMKTELLSQPVGSAPVAENLDLQTYQNVPLSARFSAVDADGDTVTFQLTDKPARGEVTIDTTDPSCFLYSPYENKRGKIPSLMSQLTRRAMSLSPPPYTWSSKSLLPK